MPAMNDRAREILTYIQRFSRDHGYPPTIREIGEAFEINSTNGVRYYLQMLEQGGFMKRSSKRSRGIELTSAQRGYAPTGIPVLGRVAAGQPTLAEENFDSRLDTNDLFGAPDGLFALRVRGDSMIDAGIHDGDYVVVRQQDRANAGQIVVALIGEEATVKYYRPKRDHIELEPANERLQPIVVQRDAEFRVLGVVKGVMRVV